MPSMASDWRLAASAASSWPLMSGMSAATTTAMAPKGPASAPSVVPTRPIIEAALAGPEPDLPATSNAVLMPRAASSALALVDAKLVPI